MAKPKIMVGYNEVMPGHPFQSLTSEDGHWFINHPGREVLVRPTTLNDKAFFNSVPGFFPDGVGGGRLKPFTIIYGGQDCLQYHCTKYIPNVHRALKAVWNRHGNCVEKKLRVAILKGTERDKNALAALSILVI